MADMGAYGIGWAHNDKFWRNLDLITSISILESFNLSIFLEYQTRMSLINDIFYMKSFRSKLSYVMWGLVIKLVATLGSYFGGCIGNKMQNFTLSNNSRKKLFHYWRGAANVLWVRYQIIKFLLLSYTSKCVPLLKNAALEYNPN